MITRITIKSEPADRSYKDRLTITRSSVRYENEPLVPGGKALCAQQQGAKVCKGLFHQNLAIILRVGIRAWVRPLL